jgi:phospholipid/cholesterol/gamma-HCH transport system permease protein
MFGAQIFIANMLGVTMARELSGLMTAIILAGRSGSAFAAELGTMKVNEELNALETMGLSPMRFLVVQRILAGILLTPLLTVYSILVAIAGGVLVMMVMGFPLVTIYDHLAQTMRWTDILIGVGKGIIFGALIGGIGCLRGLQTRQGPSAVGESTTRAVVTSILLVIVADAVVAVMLFVLHI